jgi:hypothetical protein
MSNVLPLVGHMTHEQKAAVRTPSQPWSIGLGARLTT